jgi:hypothetical protein
MVGMVGQGGFPMKTTGSLLMMVLLLFSFLSPAYAERYVVVNGQRLSIPEIQYVEQLHCGPIPNGRYWIKLQTGMWGYAGNPRPQGHIADNCRSPQRRPGLSERGMLFSPNDWIF